MTRPRPPGCPRRFQAERQDAPEGSFGLGEHSRENLSRLTRSGQLYAFDVDWWAVLVQPREEDSNKFLPRYNGYSTTVKLCEAATVDSRQCVGVAPVVHSVSSCSGPSVYHTAVVLESPLGDGMRAVCSHIGATACILSRRRKPVVVTRWVFRAWWEKQTSSDGAPCRSEEAACSRIFLRWQVAKRPAVSASVALEARKRSVAA